MGQEENAEILARFERLWEDLYALERKIMDLKNDKENDQSHVAAGCECPD